MKIGIYCPYFGAALGGGERYILTVAECLAENHQVDIFWGSADVRKRARGKLKIDLSRVSFVEDIFSSRINLIRKWQITKKYDLIFYLSDGSIPFLFAKNNILHFQVPFKNIGGRSFLNKVKLVRFNHVVCNSDFTKRFIDWEYGVESKVIYPPVAIKDFKPEKKENLVLSVGRFTQALHAKKQHILIKVFKKMCNQGLNGWRLFLAGGALKEDERYVAALKRLAKGYPIRVETNIEFAKLKKSYGKAKIFWHAAGFGEDEEKHPERMEHFGIAVVEAMAAGCVPVVIGKGGISEIIDNGENGFLWQAKEKLINLTLQLIKSPQKMKKISAQAIKDSQKFSKKVFRQKIDELIKG